MPLLLDAPALAARRLPPRPDQSDDTLQRQTPGHGAGPDFTVLLIA